MEGDMCRLKGYILISLAASAALLFTACAIEAPSPTPSPVPSSPPAPAPAPEPESEKAVIRDRTGRLWDVTHARDVYDMNPDYFNYGLGFGVISSVDDPIVLEEGDSDYPDPDSRIQVFGVNHNGEQRAYSVSALSRHEVFNDTYPGESNQYVAVAY
jgi:ABC-type Fe3+-hydroxamate transport system substrate-binding protein